MTEQSSRLTKLYYRLVRYLVIFLAVIGLWSAFLLVSNDKEHIDRGEVTSQELRSLVSGDAILAGFSLVDESAGQRRFGPGMPIVPYLSLLFEDNSKNRIAISVTVTGLIDGLEQSLRGLHGGYDALCGWPESGCDPQFNHHRYTIVEPAVRVGDVTAASRRDAPSGRSAVNHTFLRGGILVQLGIETADEGLLASAAELFGALHETTSRLLEAHDVTTGG